ncbi:transcription factor DUO1-like [Silene latifolia]|uniref:transcription factor DUO1-like n=1 Tax=Silene latifolia TaxID=37657 RepID=UPI003D77A929
MEESSYSSGKNYCYGKSKRSVTNNDQGLLKKGPWKPEEDQVLINHVKKYGPRDWSSIRSKGLLLRTGKSCRLRWVNKLRPNLKNGCKFTAEEERVVIELQSQLGNKWATIATHLVGRTDNDVKNFWSSRQKRLARIFHSQSPQPRKRIKLSSSSDTAPRNRSFFIEVSKTSLVTGETSSKLQCSSSSSSAPNKEFVLDAIPLNQYPCNNQVHLDEVMSFPAIPALQTDLAFPPETQELIDRLDSGFLQPFGCTDGPVFADDGLQFSGQMSGPSVGVIDNPVTLDGFFDDFPSDMFDQIEPLPSPSSW